MKRWLPIIFVLLILFGCGDNSAALEAITQCNDAVSTQIISAGEGRYLCLKNNLQDSELGINSRNLYVLRVSSGIITTPSYINAKSWEAFHDVGDDYQTFFDSVDDSNGRNIFYPSIRAGLLMTADDLWGTVDPAISDADWKDTSSILVGHFFGNKKNGQDKSSGTGAVGMDNDGTTDFHTQPSETGYIMKENSVAVTEAHLSDNDNGHYGLDPSHGDVDQIAAGTGGEPIPAIMACDEEYNGRLFGFTGDGTSTYEIYLDSKKWDSDADDGDGDWVDNRYMCKDFSCATHGGTEGGSRTIVLQRIDVEYRDEYSAYIDEDQSFVTGFVCSKVGGNYQWLSLLEYNEMYDNDNDGSGDLFDCDDENPFKWYPEDFFITIEDGSVYFGDKSNHKNVCGDNIDNVCEWETPFSSSIKSEIIRPILEDNQMLTNAGLIDLNIEEDCDFNSYACSNNCKKQGGNCDYLPLPNGLNSQVSTTDDPESDSEEDPSDNVVYEDDLDWGDLDDEADTNFCCGAQVDDNGRILEYDGNDYLCLNRNREFSSMNDDNSLDTFCDGDWCWVNSFDLPFESVTIKHEDSIFDTVSNFGNWYSCNESNIGSLPIPYDADTTSDLDVTEVTRFNCFNSGSVYMWGECVSDKSLSNSHSTRVRGAGESKMYLGNGTHFTLHDLSTGNPNSDYGSTGDLLYGYGLDLSDYDYLEFYVKFDDVQNYYPVDLFLSIQVHHQSDDNTDLEIYNNNVLGYSDFPYLVEGEYLRVQVPIDDWKDVLSFRFEPSVASIDYEIRNVQAIKVDEDELYCSGQQASRDESNTFIDGIDSSSDSNADVNSEDVCKQLYGDDAWFGFYYGSSAEVNEEFAACCGDKPNEYYAGSTEDLDGRACFNSEVMYDGDRAANLQFNVSYYVRDYTFEKKAYSITGDTINLFDGDDYTGPLYKNNYELSIEGFVPLIRFYDEEQPLNNNYDVVFDGVFTWDTTDVVDFVVLAEDTFSMGNNLFDDLDLPDLDEMGYAHMYWYIPELREETNDVDYNDHPIHMTLQLVAEYKELAVSNTLSEETTTYTLPCLEDECVYALPGEPPYKITNNFPGLYDLYFVVGSNEEEQYLITEENQNFSMYGNILARHVSKNVLMTNETFFSCEVPDYYFETGYENYGEQGSRCDVQTGYVCSPQDADSLINTWSNLDLDKIGYTEVTEFVEDMEFAPRTCGSSDPCDVEDLAYYVKPVPGRNLVPNADFYLSDGNRIEDWIMYDGQFDTDSLPYRENESVIVSTGFKLKSSKIAVHENSSYTVSSSGNCVMSVNGYNKEGDQFELSSSFNGATFEYIELVFEGSECTVTAPYLSTGSSLSEDFDARYPFRSGAACCPEGACWNGYICVEDMASYTFMTESVGEEDYRCIDGDWYNLPPLYDWNGDEIGYCESEGQCFVTSSLSEGITENATYSDFYNGEYPACINDGEYIFDHLCQDGEWSSRTKFVASSLLNYADDEDHVLYCTNVRDSLLDYKEDGYNYANYIEGESTTVVEETASLDEAFNGSLTGNTTISICYPELTVSETGRRLIPDEDNTCVNNVCTVRYGSGDWKTMWGTSVNIDPRDSQSLFVPLGISGSDTETFCDGDNDSWVDCNGNIWFQDNMDAIIYTQEEIGMSNTVTESIVSFLSNLFGTDQLEESEDYLEEATNFNKVYIASVDDYTIRAIEEVDGDQETIIAEYTGFETPVCDYVYNVNPSMVYVEQWPAVPDYLVNCTVDDDTSTIVTGTNRDFWWSQLTGMLRLPGVE